MERLLGDESLDGRELGRDLGRRGWGDRIERYGHQGGQLKIAAVVAGVSAAAMIRMGVAGAVIVPRRMLEGVIVRGVWLTRSPLMRWHFMLAKQDQGWRCNALQRKPDQQQRQQKLSDKIPHEEALYPHTALRPWPQPSNGRPRPRPSGRCTSAR